MEIYKQMKYIVSDIIRTLPQDKVPSRFFKVFCFVIKPTLYKTYQATGEKDFITQYFNSGNFNRFISIFNQYEDELRFKIHQQFDDWLKHMDKMLQDWGVHDELLAVVFHPDYPLSTL